jgi:hypothetical protein
VAAAATVLHAGQVNILESACNGPREGTLVEVLRWIAASYHPAVDDTLF